MEDFLIKKKPNSWIEAFHLLGQALEASKKTDKKIVFLDELPWLDTKRSNFIAGLSYFWNSWAVNQHIVVVIRALASRRNGLTRQDIIASTKFTNVVKRI